MKVMLLYIFGLHALAVMVVALSLCPLMLSVFYFLQTIQAQTLL
jgi:hypothetical protein